MLLNPALKTPHIFVCDLCDFKCSKSSDYNRHLITRKHTHATQMLSNATILAPKCAEVSIFTCKNCNKQFKHSPSLSRHKKTCSPTEVINNINTTLNEKELIITLLNQNNQLQTQIIELCKETKSIITNNVTNTNSNNKTFNLQLFLNETCKDAMNIMDFVDSIKLQLTDLEKVGKIGYVEGISNIIVKKLNINLVYTNTLYSPIGAILSRILKVSHIWHIHEFPHLNKIQKFDYLFLINHNHANGGKYYYSTYCPRKT